MTHPTTTTPPADRPGGRACAAAVAGGLAESKDADDGRGDRSRSKMPSVTTRRKGCRP